MEPTSLCVKMDPNLKMDTGLGIISETNSSLFTTTTSNHQSGQSMQCIQSTAPSLECVPQYNGLPDHQSMQQQEGLNTPNYIANQQSTMQLMSEFNGEIVTNGPLGFTTSQEELQPIHQTQQQSHHQFNGQPESGMHDNNSLPITTNSALTSNYQVVSNQSPVPSTQSMQTSSHPISTPSPMHQTSLNNSPLIQQSTEATSANAISQVQTQSLVNGHNPALTSEASAPETSQALERPPLSPSAIIRISHLDDTIAQCLLQPCPESDRELVTRRVQPPHPEPRGLQLPSYMKQQVHYQQHAANPKPAIHQVTNQALLSNGAPRRQPKAAHHEAGNGEECVVGELPDYLKDNLDIVIVGINPSLTTAHIGHHYAEPGNHFWSCVTETGLVPIPVTCYDDAKMVDYGIGFTNVCTRPTKGASELTRKEMKEGARILIDKFQRFKPKIAVFNGKGIYQAFVGHKNFYMGKQPNPLEGTNTLVFVMPSSSARCAQLPRAADKLPFFFSLKKLLEYMKGERPTLDESDVVFPDYAGLRVSQPDPKSLLKAERRRKRKAEQAREGAAAAAAAASDGRTVAPVSSQQVIQQQVSQVPAQSTQPKSKKKKPAPKKDGQIRGQQVQQPQTQQVQHGQLVQQVQQVDARTLLQAQPLLQTVTTTLQVQQPIIGGQQQQQQMGQQQQQVATSISAGGQQTGQQQQWRLEHPQVPGGVMTLQPATACYDPTTFSTANTVPSMFQQAPLYYHQYDGMLHPYSTPRYLAAPTAAHFMTAPQSAYLVPRASLAPTVSASYPPPAHHDPNTTTVANTAVAAAAVANSNFTNLLLSDMPQLDDDPMRNQLFQHQLQLQQQQQGILRNGLDDGKRKGEEKRIYTAL